MTVGERIKKARQEKGITQTELAERLGYKSRSSINKIEVEGRDIPRSMVIKFAQALGVTPSYLMGWEDENGNPNEESETAEFIRLFSQLPKDKQALVVNIIKGFLEEK